MKYLCKGMILILIINTCVLKTFGDTTFQQTILTTVPGAVNISAINQSLSKGSIAPQTGISTAPSASFNIKTNGEDCNYNYILQAKTQNSNGGDVNAYFKNSNKEYIILGNISGTNLPNTNSINNIKSGAQNISGNPNAIAYPINNTLINIQSSTMNNNSNYGGLYYSIEMGNSQNGNFIQTLDTTPLTNTYSTSNDRAGTYQAIITLTASRNP